MGAAELAQHIVMDDENELFATEDEAEQEPQEEEEELVEAIPMDEPVRRKKPATADVIEEYDEEEEEEDIEEPEVRRPARRRRRRREEDYEDEDDERDDEDDIPRAVKTKSGMSKTRRWSLGSAGFLIVAISMCVFGGAYAFTMLAEAFTELAIATSRSGGHLARAAQTILRLSQVVMLLAMIGAITGYVFCIFIPNKFGSLGLAIATVSVGTVNLILHIIFRMAPVLQDAPSFYPYIRNLMAVIGGLYLWDAGELIFSLFIELAQYAEFMLFAIFMAAVAKMQKDRHHKSDCMRIVWFLCAMAGVTLVMYILMMCQIAENWAIYIIRILNWGANGVLTIAIIFHIMNLFHSRKSTA